MTSLFINLWLMIFVIIVFIFFMLIVIHVIIDKAIIHFFDRKEQFINKMMQSGLNSSKFYN